MKLKILLFFILVLLARTNMNAEESQDSVYRTLEDKPRQERISKYFSLAEVTDSKTVISYWINKLEEEIQSDDSLRWTAKLYHQKARVAYKNGEVDISKSYRIKSLSTYNEIDDNRGSIKQLNNLGNLYSNTSNRDSAIYCYEEALRLSELIKDSNLISKTLLNLSTGYNYVGEKKQELKYLLKALEVGRATNDSLVIANCLYNLSVHYSMDNNIVKSNELIPEVVEIYKRIGNVLGIASTFNIKAKNAFDNQDPQLAILYLDSSLTIYEEVGSFSRLAMGKLNIGEVAAELKDYKKAKEKLSAAYIDFVKLKDYRYAATALSDLGQVHFAEKNYEEAIISIEKAVYIADSLGILSQQTEYLKELSLAYSSNSQYDLAYEALLDHLSIKDSLLQINNQESLREMEAKFQSEKKQLEIGNLEKAAELQEIKLEKESQQNKVLIFGLALTLLLVLFIGYSLQRKNRDNKIIRSQKEQLEQTNNELSTQKLIVEVKNNEITDSIQYAKKIQEAVLPPIDFFREAFPNSFIFYKPKDIVAGDFYWFYKKEDRFLFAVADCTGHGVPGAMVSVVCSNALNRAVGEFGLDVPSKILDQCQKLVIENLGNSESEIKDGMDISLCSYSIKEGVLEYSGANNPLWLVNKKGIDTSSSFNSYGIENEYQLFEIKADKQAIGQKVGAQKFTNHSIKLSQGDRIYLFSDGYIDQFGGDLGKKLKSRNLKELILKRQSESIINQGQFLTKYFDSWKGELEQLDDVCFMGIEV